MLIMLKNRILFLGLVHLIGSLVAAKDCGLPGIPFDGLLNGSTNWDAETRFPPGTRIRFTCSRPHQQLMDGSGSRICTENGTWTGTLPWCATNVVYDWPVVLNVSSYGRLLSRTLRGLSDGIKLADQSDQCFMVTGGDDHALTINLKRNHRFAALWIHTEDPFPLKRNRWTISTSAKWPYQISRRMTSPSIVIRGPQLYKGKQFTVAIKSDRSFSICELELFAWTDQVECGVPETPADGYLSVEKSRRNRQSARYRCREGYQLNGPSVRRCNGTRWDGVQPTCAPIHQTADSSRGNSTTSPAEGDGTPVTVLNQGTTNSMSLPAEDDRRLIEHFLSEMKSAFCNSLILAGLLQIAFAGVLIYLRSGRPRGSPSE